MVPFLYKPILINSMKTTNITEFVTKTTLTNGIRILTEHIPSVKSISAGIWVKTGSRNENEKLSGVTHFLEHMLFKGTKNRTALEIAQSMEVVGGFLNAATSNEYTNYFARCVDSELERALEVLTDMVLNPTFPEEEMEKEKRVVIEEMKMYRDSPVSYLVEQFIAKLFHNHELGRPILGTEDTVSAFTRDDLYNYMKDRYTTGNLLISVAGNVNHAKVVELVDKYMGNLPKSNSTNSLNPIEKIKPHRLELTKDIEQTHYLYGKQGLSLSHKDRFNLLMVNTLLSGGMSSRLHQNVREKYGYCYSVQAFTQSFSDSGMWGVYVGTDKEYVDHVHQIVVAELDKVATEKVTDKELSETKAQVKGSLMLSQENTSSRMRRLAQSEMYYDRFITLDELANRIDEVTADDMLNFANYFFDKNDFMEAVLLPKNG